MDDFKGYLAKFQTASNSNSLGQRFARGSFWLFIGNALAQIFGLGASIIVARLLGKVGFGEFGMINSTIGTFGVFAGLGLGLTSTKYISEWRVKEPERAGRILGFSTLLALLSSGSISVLVFLLAPMLAKDVINAPHLVSGLRISCLLLFVNALNGMQMGALSGFEAFKRSSQINIVRGISNIIFTGIGTWFFGLLGAIWATVIVGVVLCVLSFQAIQQECEVNKISISYAHTKDEVEILWKFTFPALISGIVVSPALWIGNALLVNQSNGYAEMGLLNAASQWKAGLMFLPIIFNAVALPILSLENNVDDNLVKYNNMVDITQSVSTISTVPVAVLIIFLADPIMHIFGKEYTGGVPVLIGIVAGIAISAIGGALSVVVQSKGRMWLGVTMNLIWALTYIGVVFVFVERWKAISLGLGYLVAYLILLVWGHLYLKRELPNGLIKRTFSAVAFLLLLLFISVFINPVTKIWISFPLVILCLILSIWKWSSPIIRYKIVAFLKVKPRE